jgi:hypothetical protein
MERPSSMRNVMVMLTSFVETAKPFLSPLRRSRGTLASAYGGEAREA